VKGRGTPSLIKACATPGASLCSRGRMASGVWSRIPNPVPPELSTKSSLRSSHHVLTTSAIFSEKTVVIAIKCEVHVKDGFSTKTH
jgi:hypothetical protein